MNEQLHVWRNELKYVIPNEQSLMLQEDMQKLLQPDEYSRDGSYTVRSLYFDTVNQKDLYEKDAGIHTRQKIRLRIYDISDENAKLELKAKNGDYQHKSSLIVSREEAHRLQEGDYEFLVDRLGGADETALTMYAKMSLGVYRPVTLIEYQRRAFVYGEYDTRVTFDSEIRYSESDLDIYEENPEWRNVMQDRTVLEVKYNEKLFAPIRTVISKQPAMLTSFSKYGNSRELLYL